MTTRRELLIALGALAALPAYSQQPGKVWRVGFLTVPSRPADLESHYLGAFAKGMRELGYVEGKNLVIEWRFADNDVKRVPGMAAELVQMKADVLVAVATQTLLALQKATSTIPIVMVSNNDPIALGLVKSLARPGGNITGIASLSAELGPKRLELLRAMAPKASRVAVLMNPDFASAFDVVERLRAAGPKLGVTILPVEARTREEIDKAFSTMRQQNAGALMVTLNPLFQQQRSQIAELALKQRLPSMTPDRFYVDVGCLMSYATSLADSIRRSASYVDKIFKGAKPADLPVEQPTTFELIINGKTAKALGLAIPQSLRLNADKVIE